MKAPTATPPRTVQKNARSCADLLFIISQTVAVHSTVPILLGSIDLIGSSHRIMSRLGFGWGNLSSNS